MDAHSQPASLPACEPVEQGRMEGVYYSSIGAVNKLLQHSMSPIIRAGGREGGEREADV